MKKKYSSCFPKKNPPNSLNIQEARLHVWRGESLETRFGLKKKDLVMINGKLKSKKMVGKILKDRV